MEINPYILLGIGATFALLYGCVITFGWARTRRNRRLIQNEAGISVVPLFNPVTGEIMEDMQETFSLLKNRFEDQDGNPIDFAAYDVCMAAADSTKDPSIKRGTLLFLDKESHTIRYVFDVPDLRNYR